ncbi:exodeoxyribonuclease III [Myroides marinus]|uniref:exodeoxyribonuclease III n=1 Tax=Myroides marinus TaxID=703342 RepID=UPI0025792150|nr:exodeoxyribonuclease III [Myroides marinus]MDM1348740.1 exodeoxyribonuclease III [Myroides marinus]MDM1350781.1 exodeoxyribonuclease III [Myroides marinus]MDM1354569.1 exodeoxyribonuclease III [Myroides marinus]MDM1357988.1 exodeoxyribonuclease III [Myroides marinus]MDM1365295.1 exodeoxyribonuclease III [Myroides marinus]
MKVISYNVNGIRAAINKGFIDWIQEENPDIICLQEIKAKEDQVPVADIAAAGYPYQYYYPAQKAGYSGVAILCKQEPKNVVFGTGIDYMDFEGRNVRVDYDGVSVMSLYLPSASNIERLDFKYKYMDDFYTYVDNLKKEIPNLIICGDYNICHEAIDIHDPIRNAKVSGFLPEERAWLDKFISNGFIDSFRMFNQEPHNYSWWTYRANARNNNKGWRIDYHLVTEPLRAKIKHATILPDVKHSDHCPILVEIDA